VIRPGNKCNIKLALHNPSVCTLYSFRTQKQLSTDYDVAVLQIPSSILLQMLGKSRVTKFVLQEILSITIEEFIKKVNANSDNTWQKIVIVYVW